MFRLASENGNLSFTSLALRSDGLKGAIGGRIRALANVHSPFVQSRWAGAELVLLPPARLYWERADVLGVGLGRGADGSSRGPGPIRIQPQGRGSVGRITRSLSQPRMGMEHV
jgi:HWE histidine kinase